MARGLVWALALIVGVLANSQVVYGSADTQSPAATAVEGIHSVPAVLNINNVNNNNRVFMTADEKKPIAEASTSYEKVLACILAAGIGTKDKDGTVVLKKAENKGPTPSFLLKKDGIERIASDAKEDSSKVSWSPTMERFLINTIQDHFRFQKSDLVKADNKKSAELEAKPAVRVPTGKEQANLNRLQAKLRETEIDAATASEFHSKKAQAMKDFYAALLKYERSKFEKPAVAATEHPAAQESRFGQLSAGYGACESFLETPVAKAGKPSPKAKAAPAKDQVASRPTPSANRPR